MKLTEPLALDEAFKTLKLSLGPSGVAWVTMSRAEVFNAFDEAMIGELDAAF